MSVHDQNAEPAGGISRLGSTSVVQRISVEDTSDLAVCAPPDSEDLRTPGSRPRRLPRLGAGIINDVESRLPWYKSDWIDAWNYRVVPATALIFFAK